MDLGAADRCHFRRRNVLGGGRFIPEYTELNQPDLLPGFLAGSKWLTFGVASVIGVIGAVIVMLLAPRLDTLTVIPLYLAYATIPIYGLVQIQAGIAQPYDLPNVLHLACARHRHAGQRLLGSARRPTR